MFNHTEIDRFGWEVLDCWYAWPLVYFCAAYYYAMCTRDGPHVISAIAVWRSLLTIFYMVYTSGDASPLADSGVTVLPPNAYAAAVDTLVILMPTSVLAVLLAHAHASLYPKGWIPPHFTWGSRVVPAVASPENKRYLRITLQRMIFAYGALFITGYRATETNQADGPFLFTIIAPIYLTLCWLADRPARDSTSDLVDTVQYDRYWLTWIFTVTSSAFISGIHRVILGNHATLSVWALSTTLTLVTLGLIVAQRRSSSESNGQPIGKSSANTPLFIMHSRA